MRILLIEDNHRFAELLALGLNRRGFTCDVAPDLASANEAVAVAQFDAVVVDLGLPDGTGMSWLEEQRQAGLLIPALILTARGESASRVAGLDAGADDYVVKPVEVDEIAARLRALLRRPQLQISARLETPPLCFDLVSRELHCGGQPLELTRREASLIELLMRRAGQVVGRGAIEEALYSFDEPVTPNAIDAIISRMRRKLEPFGLDGMLHTVRGVGYLLREISA